MIEHLAEDSRLRDLIQKAERKYDEYDLDALPEGLRRNSEDYYYLSVYPGLKEMHDIKNPPEYPSDVSTMYIHTPFCSGICNFCSYFVKGVGEEKKAIDGYYELLAQEFDEHKKHTDIHLKYIYFGGGTPSLIPPKTLDAFLGHLQANNALDTQIQGTFELHPEFFKDLENAQAFIDVMKKYGIMRVSIGYESSSEEVLDSTNRRHKKDFLKDAVAFIRENDLKLNIDLMYGLPGLSSEDWAKSLYDVLEVKPDSVTPYFLFVDKRTGMQKDVQKGKVQLPSHREIQTQHLMAQILLEQKGYYELPNDFFAKTEEGFDPTLIHQDRLPSDSKGLPMGAGSYGYYNGTQFYNEFNLKRYAAKVTSGASPVWRGYEMDGETLMRRDVMFSLKNEPHINRQLFIERYGKDPVLEFEPLMKKLVELQLITISEETVSLTQKGRLLAEEIACQFKDARISHDVGKGTADITLLERHSFSPEYKKITE